MEIKIFKRKLKVMGLGISLVVQWLRISLAMAEDTGLMPNLGTKIPHAN